VKIAWATDIHLDFLQREGGRTLVQFAFAEPLAATKADIVVISGDISLSSMLEDHLRILDEILSCPIYFVLGNHDFYGGNFESVRSRVDQLCKSSKHLHYLTTSDSLQEIAPNFHIVGHDGWYDGYYGRPFSGGLVMSDWIQIEDFSEHLIQIPGGATIDAHKIISSAREASFYAAEHVEKQARRAAEFSKNVLIVTHVPPFPEVHMHGGKGSNEASIPWYTSKLMGDAITRVSEDYPGVSFAVFCGHTHEKARIRKSKNVECFVGGSEYGEPSYNMVEIK
jgi:predicted phosphohydrolase